MDQQTHIVSGVYTSRAEAEAVCDRLVEAGVLRELISLPTPHAGRAFAKKQGSCRPLALLGSCPTWLAAAPL